jgi:hypothetical protein
VPDTTEFWARCLMAALDAVAGRPELADVSLYAERWKRLGERVHPHEYPRYPRAMEAFAVARGEVTVPSASTCRTGPSPGPAGCSPAGSATCGLRLTGGTPWTGASSPRLAP